MKAFCEECREFVNYNLTEKVLTGNAKGERCSYTGKEARCEKCGSLVYIPEILDYNLKALYDEYRKKHGIMSAEEIRKVPEKYKIGKGPLSLLLGWGKNTYTHYCEGHTPTKKYSDAIAEIASDPEAYLRLLEEGRDKIKPEAYKKSRLAVEDLLTVSDKLETVALYITHCCEDITPLALQKALYYVQGFGYAFNDTFPFSEDCEAWIHGPVFDSVYHRYKNLGFRPIEQAASFDASLLTTDEKAVCDSVIKNLCCYSGDVLRAFTHTESPWINARKGLASNEPSDRIIPKSDIGAYFKEVREKHNMVNLGGIKEYAMYMRDKTE